MTKIGEARVSDFFNWAMRNVLKEDTPWIKVVTVNGTYSWSLKAKSKAKTTKKRARAGTRKKAK